MRGAGLGASLEGAVDAVPAGDAEAGPVLALAVEAATRIAASILTTGSGPTIGANAGGVLTSTNKKKNSFFFFLKKFYPLVLL